MKTKQKQIDKAITELKGGYYGFAEIIDEFENNNYYLIRTEIADPDEEWECSEYHLLQKDLSASHFLAHCDGYNGAEWQMKPERIEEIIDDEFEAVRWCVRAYNATGELLAAAKLNAATEAYEDYEGVVEVWVEYCYSDSTWNKPNDGFAKDDSGNEIIFDNYTAAEKWIDEKIGRAHV